MPGLVAELERLVGADHVRTGVGLSPFVVEGRTPEAAVFPGSVEEVQAVVSLAAEAGVPLLPWGGGTAITVGMPVTWSGLVLGVRRLKRILEHEPGDLTVTLEAGITVAELRVALAEKRQWLSLDPPDAERATLGGVVAADASGPRRHLYGTARDLLIGATIVTADGTLVRGGGKVVKNVAGYDLPKLFIGSYGTLGVVVDLTFKLRPLPDAERFFVVSFDAIKDAGAAVRAVMASDLIPTVLDLLDADAGRALGLGASQPPSAERSIVGRTVASAASLVVAFDGLPEQIDWQRDELQRLVACYGAHGVVPLAAEAVARLGIAARDAFDEPASVMRFAVLPTHVPDLAEQGAAAARARGFNSAWAAHAGVGVVTGALAPSDAPNDVGAIAAVLGDWRAIARANGGFATLESAPIAVKSVVPVWDDLGAAARIMRRIKRQLDPKNILNPDRIVGTTG